jgi:hypothetical protein
MKLLQLFSLILILGMSCKKYNAEPDRSSFSGTYKGTLYSGLLNNYQTSNTEIHFDKNNYNSSNSIQRPGSNLYTFGASTGTYEAKPGKKINFTNTPTFYTAEFDWGTILNGDYAYITKDDSLILNKVIKEQLPGGSLIYQYRLKRLAN